ncbi:hypothetical protein KM885_17745 [Oceanobacillus caeni]|uniref:hypothetical protein n=1 Tax=Oceanobacillus caeni TaxID=405946 RepID=UPI001C23A1FF|nr:hypothetical protein [Oceanobacillus caeni]MBU8792561.1 hypothetical protein [Oceanobacillus caeni]
MKLKNIFNLQKLYFLFILRRILSVGILKEKIFKAFIFIATIVTITVTTVFLYNFLDDTDVSEQINFIYFIIKMQGVNIIVWTMIIFVFTRIIFLKKGDFLKITNQLPITHNERNSSFIIFELLMSLTIIFLISMDLRQVFGHKKIKFFCTTTIMDCSTSQVDCQSEKIL